MNDHAQPASPPIPSPSRFMKALLIVTASLSLGLLMIAMGSSAIAASADTPCISRLLFECTMQGQPLDEALAEAGFLTTDIPDIPPWFTEEITGDAPLESFISNEDYSAVFVRIRRAPNETPDTLANLFATKGWKGTTNAEKGFLSLTKEEGRCRWMTVSIGEDAGTWNAALSIQQESQG